MTKVPCLFCDQRGRVPCNHCDGTGQDGSPDHPCSWCSGGERECTSCQGEGVVEARKATTEACPHMNFRSAVAVGRITKGEGGPVIGYSADVSIMCNDCGQSFRFMGLPAGSHPTRPMVSFDGTELRAPIEPVPVADDLKKERV